MCMPMGGSSAPRPQPIVTTPVMPQFDTDFNKQLTAKKPVTAPITRDNPFLTKGQRGQLDTKNATVTEQTGVQMA